MKKQKEQEINREVNVVMDEVPDGLTKINLIVGKEIITWNKKTNIKK